MISLDFQSSLQIEKEADYLTTTNLLNSNSPKNLVSNGVALINLTISNIKSKLNRWELELTIDPGYNNGDVKLNDSDIKTGDIVGIGPYPPPTATITSSDKREFQVNGVVTTITNTKCIIDVSGTPDASRDKTPLSSSVNQAGNRSGSGTASADSLTQLSLAMNQRVWILKLINETPYKRMDQAMRKLCSMEEQHQSNSNESGIIDVLLGSRPPLRSNVDHMDIISPNLNVSQREAINYALNSELTIIHGPPGTGKTKTVVEFILSSLKLNPNKRILVTAGSNVAVDTILERLVVHRDILSPTQVVRVGHPAKMLSAKSVDNASDEDIIDKKLKAVKLKRDRKEKRNAKRENQKNVNSNSNNQLKGMSALEYRNHLLNTTHLQYILHHNFQPILKTINEDLKKLERQLDKPGTKYSERRALYSEIRDVQKEKKNREQRALMEVLRNSRVIIGTVVGLGANNIFFGIKDLLKEMQPSSSSFFDTLIIDEVSQTLEPACWIPILSYTPNKLVLAGDNKQLSPTIHCTDSDLMSTTSTTSAKDQIKASNTLNQTLFDRLVLIHSQNGVPPSFVKFLNTQYRMNELIQRFSSDEFYGGQLKADLSVKDHSLGDFVKQDNDDDIFEDEDLAPLIWEDTCGLHCEFTDLDSGSKYNIGECHLVKKHIKKLISYGIKEEIIGVIAPYSAQVTKLRDIIWNRDNEGEDQHEHQSYPNVEISTVDGFQGREKEIIILTLVRSNDDKEVGFLSDFKRLNVSITRAKRQLYVIGDFETITQSTSPILRDWANWMSDNGVIKYVEN